jgi:hypothetical protein
LSAFACRRLSKRSSKVEAIRETAWRAAFLGPFIVVRDGVFPSHGLLTNSVINSF